MAVKEFMRKYCMVSISMSDPASNEIWGIKRPRIVCKDGFSISVQGSENHYCQPRENLIDKDYESVELGFPSVADDLIEEFAEEPECPCDTVYGWVPIDIVEKLVEKHGGIKGPDEESLKWMEDRCRCSNYCYCTW